MSSEPHHDLAYLNGCDRANFVACLGAIFEHSPWVAERTIESRPFGDVTALHAAMIRVVETAADHEKLALMRAHPELAGREAVAGTMTDASTGEQGRLGLTRLSPAEFQRITQLNRAYREKFAFPCIIALGLHESRSSVLDEMERRLDGEPDRELANAITQIGHITRGRLLALFGDS